MIDPEEKSRQLADMLAEVVAWQGVESHADYCNRLNRAEKLLKKLAPDVLKKHNADVEKVS